MMKIAIVGAGFCGLAVAVHIYRRFSSLSPISLTLFDPTPIGEGVSGLAAGLLHPFAGAHAKLNRNGREGFASTLELLQLASATLGCPVTLSNHGILRLALSEEQKKDYDLCAQRFPEDVLWYSEERCTQEVQGCAKASGLLIPTGLSIHSELYLKGLWKWCENQGAIWNPSFVTSLSSLKEFTHVIIATGAKTNFFPEFSQLGIHQVKGQVFELDWPSQYPPLPYSLNSQAYLLMSPDQHSCILGTTYERDFVDESPDIEKAKAEIYPKAEQIFPGISQWNILKCRAGLRATTPNHLPLIHQWGENRYLLTGMGSKGLLYHALSAKQVVDSLS